MSEPPCQASPVLDLSQLVKQHQAEIWRYLRYLGAQAAEADDLVQETFLAIARSQFEQRSDAESAAYLRITARRQLLMLRRSQRREPLTTDLEAAESVWAERTAAGTWDDQVTALQNCVEQLDGRARRAIDLHYQEKTSRDAIAQQLEMKPDGVKTLLRRTRSLLKECIERALRPSH